MFSGVWNKEQISRPDSYVVPVTSARPQFDRSAKHLRKPHIDGRCSGGQINIFGQVASISCFPVPNASFFVRF